MDELRYGVIFERKKIDGEYILKKKYATIGWVYQAKSIPEAEEYTFHVSMGELVGELIPSVSDKNTLEYPYCVRYLSTTLYNQEINEIGYNTAVSKLMEEYLPATYWKYKPNTNMETIISIDDEDLIKKYDLLFSSNPHWEKEIIGQDEALQEIYQICKNNRKLSYANIDMIDHVLIEGPEGVGKTTLAHLLKDYFELDHILDAKRLYDLYSYNEDNIEFLYHLNKKPIFIIDQWSLPIINFILENFVNISDNSIYFQNKIYQLKSIPQLYIISDVLSENEKEKLYFGINNLKTVSFKKLEDGDLINIANKVLQERKQKLKEVSIDLEWDQKYINYLMKIYHCGENKEHGAKPIIYFIDEDIKSALCQRKDNNSSLILQAPDTLTLVERVYHKNYFDK